MVASAIAGLPLLTDGTLKTNRHGGGWMDGLKPFGETPSI
jgi:hypothetical protein